MEAFASLTPCFFGFLDVKVIFNEAIEELGLRAMDWRFQGR